MASPISPDLAKMRTLIAGGRSGEVIDSLLTYANLANDNQLQTEMVMLSGQWKNLHLPSTTATQPQDYIDRKKAQINQGLISIIDNMERGMLPSKETTLESPASIQPAPAPAAPPPPSPPPPLPSQNKRWKEIVITIAAVVAFLAGAAELTGYSLRDLFTTPPATTTTPAQPVTDTPVTTTPIDSPVVSSPPPAPTPKPVETRTKPTEPAAKLSVDLKTNKGTKNLVFTTGEDLEIFYRATQPCTLRVLYKLADEEVVLIQDNLAVSAASIGRWISLGTFEVSEPLGAESLHVFASTGPFPVLNTSFSDGYNFVTDGLPNALRKTRGIKRKYVKQELQMTTQK